MSGTKGSTSLSRRSVPSETYEGVEDYGHQAIHNARRASSRIDAKRFTSDRVGARPFRSFDHCDGSSSSVIPPAIPDRRFRNKDEHSTDSLTSNFTANRRLLPLRRPSRTFGPGLVHA